MRLIFLGDVVGKSGREALAAALPALRGRYRPDLVVVNGENAAHGFGITEEIFQGFLAAGADVVTLGNHAFDQREALIFVERYPNLLRPVNWPKGCPGRGSALVETQDGRRVLVMNAMGRVMIEPMLDDPFPALQHELDSCPLGMACDAVLIDFHAETTSEKMAMGHFCDGRASMVVGTHTHVPTADAQVLAGGTGYLSDAGMCGDYDSVIGMDKAEPLRRFVTGMAKARFTPAEGEATLSGVLVETDDRTGKATSVTMVRQGGRLAQAGL